MRLPKVAISVLQRIFVFSQHQPSPTGIEISNFGSAGPVHCNNARLYNQLDIPTPLLVANCLLNQHQICNFVATKPPFRIQGSSILSGSIHLVPALSELSAATRSLLVLSSLYFASRVQTRRPEYSSAAALFPHSVPTTLTPQNRRQDPASIQTISSRHRKLRRRRSK